ncbi:pilus assembly protein [Streptomyces sp. NBC_00237]|uniref:TadE family protein n=1 Tax=Streptomyces sp. NBC_00237 TaxID=2975687 RepID=UPI00225B068B|nr:TadE family protein [Streptomyces sp. NBC_00237]MCX5204943.1 pilus assembly protein [Streptomyces sp. NBC_00237]
MNEWAEAYARRRGAPGRRAASGTAVRAGSGGSGDEGMTAIEFVLLTPVLFFMIFATVQFGLYSFADHVAQASVQAGARKARATADRNPGEWQGAAREVAESYVAQLGPQLLIGPEVATLQPGQNTVGVEITARVPTVFPGLDLTVHAESQGPVERFVPDGEG